ncbi:MAG: hypothetical protein O2856_16850, partial [Planctomycetota bacterium]|nr:hypothetical protein [Planctomycetota bacterium]
GTPAENPEGLGLVMVDEPTAAGIHYGGTVAAPTASRILRYAASRVENVNVAGSKVKQPD